MMDIQQKELDDARRGTLYFLGRLDLQPVPSFDLGLVSNFVTGTGFLSDLKTGCLSIVNSCDQGKKVLEGISEYTTPIKDLIAGFIDALTDRIAQCFGESAPVMEWVGEFATWAISSLAGSLADIIPGWGYVQAASDLYDGVKQSIRSAIKWLGQLYSGYGVKLLQGGPTIMAEALARHNALGLAGGLKDIAVTGLNVGLTAAGDAVGGVGAIINALLGVLQRIANLLGYCIQRWLVGRSLNQARTQWESQGEMLKDAGQFLQWFKKAAAFTPIIPTMTLLSGYTGHPYRFLQLISSGSELINQKQFDKGVDHISKLKDLAKDYATEWQSGYKLQFTSADPVIAGTLKNLQA